MNKVTDKIAGCEITTFTFNGKPYMTTFELAGILDTLNDDTGLSRFLEILNARPECELITTPDGKEAAAIPLKYVCSVLHNVFFYPNKDTHMRVEKFFNEFKEKILPKNFSQDKMPDEKEHIKKFVADYAKMFGITKLEAFKEIVQRKFNPPDDLRYWIQLTIDKEWLA